MDKAKVIILPEVEDFIQHLPAFLVESGYKINIEFADRFADELVNFMYNIPNLQSYKIDPKLVHHFERYGDNMRYVFWKRGNTTWYVFFERKEDTILVEYISNNWIDGQYIR